MKRSLFFFVLIIIISNQKIIAQTIDNHFFFLNSSLVNSDPVTYVPGSVFLNGADYNVGSNTGYPSYLNNYYSNNVSMTPFCSSARKTVYNFRQKTGLQYNNGSGSNFNDYTITVIIKFNAIVANTYYRVIDFSNGTSDNGIYAFGNNLNFYPTGNIANNVFNGSQFTFLTITRDGSTKQIKVYVNDNLVTTYNDTNDYYEFPSNGNIVFARDNIPPSSAPNEDTNGQIAYIHVTNGVSTDTEVKDVYDNICSLIPPNIDAVNDTEPDANWQTGGTVLNVFDNDERENVALNPSDITMTVTTPDPTGNITLNADGTVDLLPNAPIGTYTLTYNICDTTYPSICDTATVTVGVLPLPTITSTTGALVCSQGFAQISATTSSGIINWYASLTGGTPLDTGNNYTTPTVTTTTTYYAEAVDNWRISNIREPVTLTVQNTAIPTVTATQTFCDIENATVSNLTATGTAIQWYTNATGGTPLAITETLVNGTYYVTQTENTCESPREPVNVIIYETIVALAPSAIPIMEICDTVTDGDDTNGYANFNLTLQESLLLNGKNATDFTFAYYEDAARSVLILTPNNFTNTIQNGQTIYARIYNNLDNSCYTDINFSIQVNSLPVTSSIVDLIQCDDNTDGISPFNLTEANELISTNHLNETFTYYLTDADAQSGLTADQIANYTTYSNPTALNSVVYARIENTSGCFRTARVNLIVGVSQIPASFTTLEYYECDNKFIDNDNANGIATFDFSDAKTQIEAFFPSGGVTVSFYNNEADALAESNEIPDISNHRNDGYPYTQNIYVRVDSDAVNACLGLGQHVTLNVDPLPIEQTIIDYTLCSDANDANFDLTTKAPEVIGAQTRLILVSYHETEQDAINNVAIVNPTSYTSISKTIYVRAQFDDNNNGTLNPRECVNTDMSFNLVVNPNPVLTQPDGIVICSEQVNTTYDLTLRTGQITNNDSSITLEYYESLADVTSNIPIAAPEIYINTQLDRDIIVLATGTNTCTSTTTLSLKTILYANLNQNPLPIEECEVDNNGFDNFDLRRRETEILNGLTASDFIFNYYEIEADAIAGSSNIIQNPENFINTAINSQTIYANIKPVGNDCWQVVPITLIVNPVPEIDIEDEYVICLDATVQSIPPQLNTFLPNPPIDTKLSIADYSFQWYSDDQGLLVNEIVGANDAFYTPTEAGDYTVIATNRITGCTIPASTKVIGSYPPESITVELGSDTFSGNNVLNITVVGNGEYEYRLDTTDWQSSTKFEGVIGGERTVYVRDIYNCNEISEMKIIIDYPKFFTPNGDGTHDTWNIKGLDTQTNAKIYVYDRYGKLLKQLSPSTSGWDGTFSGKTMPESDYWFTVEFTEPRDNTVRIFKAHFALKR